MRRRFAYRIHSLCEWLEVRLTRPSPESVEVTDAVQRQREKHVLVLMDFCRVVAGWLTGRSLEGEGYGRFMNIAMGIGGAVAGGFLMHTAGFFRHQRNNPRELGSCRWCDGFHNGSCTFHW